MHRTERLELRLSARDLELLDQVRGSATRSAWLRNQIIRAAESVRSNGSERLDKIETSLRDRGDT